MDTFPTRKRRGYAGTESHYGVGGRGARTRLSADGTVWQWQDRRHEADANLDGRHRVISIETADNFPASAADIEPWTPLQCRGDLASCSRGVDR